MDNVQEIIATIIFSWAYVYMGYLTVNMFYRYTEEEMYTYQALDILLWPLIFIIILIDEVVEYIKDFIKRKNEHNQ